MSQILINLIKDLALFPLWWYTRGFLNFVMSINDWWSNSLKRLNLLVWIRNIFVPMYGQRDIAGILVSIFMRITQIIFRAIAYVFVLISGLLALAAWLLAPAVVLAGVIWQLANI